MSDKTMHITLCLDLANERDKNIYNHLKAFAEKRNITDESEALKAFMVYLHFLGCDMRALSDKISEIY